MPKIIIEFGSVINRDGNFRQATDQDALEISRQLWELGEYFIKFQTKDGCCIDATSIKPLGEPDKEGVKIYCSACKKHVGTIDKARMMKGISYLCPQCERSRIGKEMKEKLGKTDKKDNSAFGDIFGDDGLFGDIFGKKR